MSITHTIGLNWAGGTGSVGVQKTTTLTGQVEVNLDFQLAASTTNQQEGLAFTLSKLQDIYISSDQTITLKTNSSGSPQDTITITAGNPFVWYTGSGVTNPFAGNVTTGYFTNAGSTAANISVRSLATA